MGFYCINTMLLLWIAIGTVEICVLVLIVAAAVLAAAIRPSDNQAVQTIFASGEIISNDNTPTIASLSVNVRDYNSIEILRSALPPGTSAAALAITVKKIDILIEERLTLSGPTDPSSAVAMYTVAGLTPNTRYHVHFNSAVQSRHCAFTLLTTPGYTTVSQLHH